MTEVEVRGHGIPTSPGELRSVTEARATDGSVRFLLATEASPRDLFRELAEAGAEVERFAVEAPDLDEIFIRTVAGDPRAVAVA